MTTRAEVISRLAAAVADAGARAPLAQRLGETCRSILDGDGAAITLAYTLPQRLTVCSTDDVSSTLEDLQDILGEGPGVDAYRTARTVVARLGDHGSGPVWPLFTEAARREVGMATVVAIPVPMGSDVLGVLTTYRSGSDHPEPEAALAAHLAAAVGAALLRDPDLADPPGEFTGAWAGRAEVHQATGFLVAQLGLSPDDALALLRACAYADEVTVADVARRVIERTLDLSALARDRRQPPAGL
ncbi:ANTAR domain-containing protein [Jiangella ureilytica]|uniref:ANTAR domain-containing protein n=1 Tax=Jiangella ureilytica TaxID=2530374 RepID=UPI0013A5DEAB|nr:ANTAR domain-containing protein [Jiangella ureilytica]